MIRALGNGVSGLNNHQIKMDVIGNNIANVNTIAYKKGRVTFNEVLGQEFQSSGRSPGGEPTNPSYIGLGIHVGTIDQAWTQGPLENTNLPTDFAINGDGFFIARSGPQYMLSRARGLNPLLVFGTALRGLNLTASLPLQIFRRLFNSANFSSLKIRRSDLERRK